MTKNLLIAMIVLGGFAVGSPRGALAQDHIAGGVIIAHTEINIGMVAKGWSVAQLLRGNVVNEKDEFVGYVHDAIVTPTGETSYVIVNVAGFLGIPVKLIALPSSAFSVVDNKNLLLPGATKENLKALPAFRYAAN